jgi:murein DD-endopeptidase MepM/ murein hydrolase activator NlpD
MRGLLVLAFWLGWAFSLQAARVSKAALSLAADDVSCSPGAATTVFHSQDRQAFLWFVLADVRAGERLIIEWTAPDTSVAQSTDFGELSAARALCVVTPLPIAGFPPASQPGAWSARIRVGGAVARSLPFRIQAARSAPATIASVTARQAGDTTQIVVNGTGLAPDNIIHVAQYTPSGGWRYIASQTPGPGATPDRLLLTTPRLPPGEYVVLVRAGQALSAPARFLIGAEGGYKLPIAAGDPWLVTQGPYGAFSHWNRSLHAWDIAPTASRRVVAMRAGIAYTHDLRLGRTLDRRSFGNYITIDHGDGEYSHYAHLASGSFLVHNGQRVEQGQPLALAGNSGYALGEGGGVHLHVHVTRSPSIAAPSIPLHFADAPGSAQIGFHGRVVSANLAPSSPPKQQRPAPSGDSQIIRGEVLVAQWWSRLVPVSRRARTLTFRLSWEGADRDADLHVVSPGGRHFGWYGDTSGYSGRNSTPEEICIRHPEPGMWRVAVQGIRSEGAPVSFEVDVLRR